MDNCPHCGVSLLGDPIPARFAHMYAGKYWKRELGFEDPAIYDGVLYYECPDCKGRFGGIHGR